MVQFRKKKKKLFLNYALQKHQEVQLIAGIFQVNTDLLFSPHQAQTSRVLQALCTNYLQPVNLSRRHSNWNYSAATSYPVLICVPSAIQRWLQKTTQVSCKVQHNSCLAF